MKTQGILNSFILMLFITALPLSVFAQSFNDQTITDNSTENSNISPTQGDVIAVNGQSNNIFSANWSPGANWVPGISTAYNDHHPIAYIWQLSNGESFDTILISQEVANTFHYTTTSALMDSILQTADVRIGDTVVLYHRVIASDGNWQNTGQALSIKVVRTAGVVEVNPINTATLAPVPAHDATYLNIDASEPFNGSVMVTDMAGRILMSSPLNITAVGQTRVKIDVEMMERGIYFVTVVQDGNNVALLKLIKQ